MYIGKAIRYPGGFHFFNSNFIGPGTKTNLRLDPITGEPLPHSLPTNKIDATALDHDRAYDMFHGNKYGEHIADRMMVSELDAIPYSSLTPYEKVQKFLVRNAINAKQKLGLGVSEQDAHEMHHRIVRHFPRRSVIVNNIDDIWSADLVEMPNDKGYHYILTVIDVFSKYAWAIPLKNKTAQTIIDAFKSIFKTSNRKCLKLWTDAGSEFTNKAFKNFCTENDIEPYQTFNEGKAVVIERFNRTLKEKMWLQFTINGTKAHWVQLLPKLLNDYNNSYHRTIKATPTFASRKENEQDIRTNINKTIQDKQDRTYYAPPKFHVGDLVRIYKYKIHFEKGYETNFTKEVFRVTEVLHTIPITYKIEALDGEQILGSMYEPEMVRHRFTSVRNGTTY